jgi:hypothetical protein
MFLAASLVAADTQSIDFTPGGLVRMTGSTGSLTIEAWDKPTVELTTTKSPGITVSADRKGNDLEIVTTIAKHSKKIDITYHLWVPRDSRLAIDHSKGEINVEGLTGDIAATLHHGEIFLYLPEDAPYFTKAECKAGDIYSDFTAGDGRKSFRLGLGHRVVQEANAKGHALDLKVGFGDIVIYKQILPKPSLAATSLQPQTVGR